MPFYEVTGDLLIQAFSMAQDKKVIKKRRWWRRIHRGEIISRETALRYSRNCQCSIDPANCPVHGR